MIKRERKSLSPFAEQWCRFFFFFFFFLSLFFLRSSLIRLLSLNYLKNHAEHQRSPNRWGLWVFIKGKWIHSSRVCLGSQLVAWISFNPYYQLCSSAQGQEDCFCGAFSWCWTCEHFCYDPPWIHPHSPKRPPSFGCLNFLPRLCNTTFGKILFPAFFPPFRLFSIKRISQLLSGIWGALRGKRILYLQLYQPLWYCSLPFLWVFDGLSRNASKDFRSSWFIFRKSKTCSFLSIYPLLNELWK